MLSGKRTVVGIGVLVLGACAALPFRKDRESSPTASNQSTSDQLQWRPNDITLEVSVPAEGSPPAYFLEDRDAEVWPAQKAVVQKPVSLDNSTPPKLASNFPGGPQTPVSPIVLPPSAVDTPPSQAVIRHRLADGDTLQELSAKYLGAADRYWDIFEANRNVLSSPDLLPLDVEIVIPLAQKPKSPPPQASLLVPPPGPGGTEADWGAQQLAPVPPNVIQGLFQPVRRQR